MDTGSIRREFSNERTTRLRPLIMIWCGVLVGRTASHAQPTAPARPRGGREFVVFEMSAVRPMCGRYSVGRYIDAERSEAREQA